MVLLGAGSSGKVLAVSSNSGSVHPPLPSGSLLKKKKKDAIEKLMGLCPPYLLWGSSRCHQPHFPERQSLP